MFRSYRFKYSYYLLMISIGFIPHIVYAECGNGIVENGEACDDGNGNNFDLCDVTCQVGVDIPMVPINAGVSAIGSARSRFSSPRHNVKIEYNFLVSKTEITHAQYRRCVEAEACTEPASATGCIWNSENSDNFPINCVSWDQANQFAAYVGGRLLSESEWEFVASSGDDRIYPWGNEDPVCDFGVLKGCSNSLQEVCSSEDVPRSSMLETQAYQVCDLAGNVAEWTKDNYSKDYLNHPTDGSVFETNDRLLRFYRVLRGGSLYTPAKFWDVSYREPAIYLYQKAHYGIRIAKTNLCGNGLLNQDFNDDGIPDPLHPDYEECDDNNFINSDGCDVNCTVTACGNGIVNQDFDNDGEPDLDHPNFEFCDGRPVEGRDCLDTCLIDTCGDGEIQVNFGEQCDDGLDNNSNSIPNACRENCRQAFCGDGVIDEGETCDEGLNNNDTIPNACRTDCSLPSCGDKVIDDGEACDNGFDNDDNEPNACRTTCVTPICNDSVVDDGEDCDDGNNDNNDSCDANCIDEVCGNGVLQVHLGEQCDDANDSQNDDCLIGCIAATCGDGFVQTNVEVCDDANVDNGDGCDQNCTVEADHSCLPGDPSNCFPDRDFDLIADAFDNCPDKPNNDQVDTDEDNIGDECDPSFDQDDDDVFDGRDNCPNHPNSFQEDFDNDGDGDACDDSDGDGVFDALDNCRDLFNNQDNHDDDLIGDACDDDDDNDGLLDTQEDLNQNGVLDAGESNPLLADTDGDTITDFTDNCLQTINLDQLNTDKDLEENNVPNIIGDEFGNACDDDDDNDGAPDVAEDVNTDGTVDLNETNPLNPDTDSDSVLDGIDNCPLTTTVDQTDTDLDGEGDACDDDDDNDGLDDLGEEAQGTDPLVEDTDEDTINDDIDNCPVTPNQDQINTDGQPDGGDACDDDDDDDGLNDNQEDLNNDGVLQEGESDPKDPDTDDDNVPDGIDNCKRTSNNNQSNFDADALGDLCDDDDDNDGLLDTEEDLNGNQNLDAGETDPKNQDTDGDFIRDDIDNCKRTQNNDQKNTDVDLNRGDNLGDACDPDDDNDGLDDNEEDLNGNGIIDEGETNSLNHDSDGDTVIDGNDNCPITPSVDQTDTDGDTEGDACDLDDDNDGLTDIEENNLQTDPLLSDTDNDTIQDNVDNCPTVANNDQRNTDEQNDGGDACDPDDDNDGLDDVQEDSNGNGNVDPNETDPKNPDTDADGKNDFEDNCKRTLNPDQQNTDGDAQGDACDLDDDNDNLLDTQEDANGNNIVDPNETHPKIADTDTDGIQDDIDNCPRVLNANQTNTDLAQATNNLPGDALGDACDPDDDNDGATDLTEDKNSNGQVDQGETSPFNPDSDGDSVLDGSDNCPLTASVDQTNTDGLLDGGDACDTDDDEDGLSDIEEVEIFFTDPLNPDSDDDGRGDANDNCPNSPNNDQRNTDNQNDGGDACDNDDDNDGLLDIEEDLDGDGFLDNNETSPTLADTDNDNVGDADDNCPRDFNTNQQNTDGQPDGGDECDDDDDDDTLLDTEEDQNANRVVDANETDPKNPDTDNDNVFDHIDNCPLESNSDQRNTDAGPNGDAQGDACDNDDDNDGLTDDEEDLNGNNQKDPNETDLRDPDTDGDTVIDGNDNCPLTSSVDQTNTDGLNDGGDACDLDDDEDGLSDFDEIEAETEPLNPDTDNDGRLDGADNCPTVSNADQTNTDGLDDGGNACDPDDDEDGVLDQNEGLINTNPLNPDSDGDTVLDGVDNCPVNANQNQLNTDGLEDGGDECDDDDDEDGLLDGEEAGVGTLPKNPDFDNDGRLDGFDNCPLVGNNNQLNTDGQNDGGDACDDDDDNDGLTDNQENNLGTDPLRPDSDDDGVIDGSDNCPLTSSVDQTNTDGLPDGGDACDTDDDEDGLSDQDENIIGTDDLNPDTDGDNVLDGSDNCPTVSNPDQGNVDKAPDGGNACDDDDDNDTLADVTEEILGTNPAKADTDDDGIRDDIDNCPLNFNNTQANTDGRNDGGDACDDDDDEDGLTDNQEAQIGTLRLNPDSDGDTFFDGFDNCPTISNEGQENTDGLGDGGDACDSDDDEDGLLDVEEPPKGTSRTNPDTDGDGFLDGFDNCPITNSVDQTNTDGVLADGGDACDNDDDNDGLTDIEEVEVLFTDPLNPDTDADGDNDNEDNCPLEFNPNQENADDANDGGDACDDDDDNDGLTDIEEQGLGTSRVLFDTDGDGRGDQGDNCPLNQNFNQENFDGDTQGDLCDLDDDNDGLLDTQEDLNNNNILDNGETDPKDIDTDDDGTNDAQDNCPRILNANQANSDGADDGGDACDEDSDNDGLLDTEEDLNGNGFREPTETSLILADTDGDGLNDKIDNCPIISNVDQSDFEGDGQGDTCDTDDDNDGLNDDVEDANGNGVRDFNETSPFNSDSDNDGTLDGADNCPLVPNGDQTNSDADSDGNACDLDDDNDGLLDTQEDINVNQVVDAGETDPLDPDTDNDGTGDLLDNCRLDPNGDQANFDGDTEGNSCDDDDDNDGLNDAQEDLNNNGAFDQGETDLFDEDTDNDGKLDGSDNCPLLSNQDQVNTDGDTEGDVCDTDDDNDGISDTDETDLGTSPLLADTDGDGINDPNDNCPLLSSVNLGDNDLDGAGDVCDNDDDNDGLTDIEEFELNSDSLSDDTDGDTILDGVDNCILVQNTNQDDNELDGQGDICDLDDDNDGFVDSDEIDCQSNPNDAGSTPPDADGDNVCDQNDSCFGDNNTNDTDTDGACDDIDDDDDNDGISDNDEIACQSDPKNFNSQPVDSDFDNVCDPLDDCSGNDAEGDSDNDDICDDIDNCKFVSNFNQSNFDGVGDGGDACDTDDDNDNVLDLNEDTNNNGVVDPGESNPFDTDSDDDQVPDGLDSEPANRFACSDVDEDTCDDCSSGTFSTAFDGVDTDGNGECDSGDDDNDGDGASDFEEEACNSDPLDAANQPIDSDNDFVCDVQDNCPDDQNFNQTDSDGNQIGDACDCGDGIIAGDEDCDTSNQDTNVCNFDCTFVLCGDGHTNFQAGELCDDGNQNNSDACPDDFEDGGSCVTSFCGDGFIRTFGLDNEVEECDDENTVNGDGCDNNCTITACGNGVLTANESCDDNNLVDGDGCDSNCAPTACGNGVVTANEECDDGNLDLGDGCNADCVFEAPCYRVDACPNDLNFVQLEAGTFNMGDPSVNNSQPVHAVTLGSYKLSVSEITVGQYRACVNAQACAPPQSTNTESQKSNYQRADEDPNRPNKEDYPMNRITWNEAIAFSTWVGGRLPTEAEWEYAATSEGLPNVYSWGDEAPDCTLAVMKEDGGVEGCNTGGSVPVCSRSPAGDTVQGLCDMTGNLVEWTQDERSSNYNNADPNGSAYIVDVNNDPLGDRFYRMTRGGVYQSFSATQLENRRRFSDTYFRRTPFTGFRVARDF